MAIELEIAKSYKKQIFPVWITGKDWSQSAPVSLVLSQYIDLRQLQRSDGIIKLVGALKDHLATVPIPTAPLDDSWPFLQVTWQDKHIYLNPFHKTWGEVLTEIYLSLVENTFPAFSYGEAWALELKGLSLDLSKPRQEDQCFLFALPASWAAMPFRRVHEINHVWMQSPAEVALASIVQAGRPENKVQVVDLRTLPRGIDFIGLRSSCSGFLSFARHGHSKSVIMDLLRMSRINDGTECSRGFEHFRIPQPRMQAVTIQNWYFKSAFHEEMKTFLVRDGNIIEFANRDTIELWRAPYPPGREPEDVR